MVSDQDSAFLAGDTVDQFKKRGIKLSTTIDTNHHILGPINRLMRTLPDQRGHEKGPFTRKDMETQMDIYNNNRHSAIRTAPNQMNWEKEQEFIKRAEEKKKKVKDYDIKVGDSVRYLLPYAHEDNQPKAQKPRTNYTKDTFKVIQRNGRSFILQAKDGSTDTVAGFNLRVEKDTKRYPHGEEIKHGKRGAIETVKDYNIKNHNYTVKYEGDSREQTLSERNMRESQPTKLSLEERRYWVRKCPNFPKGVPARIKNMEPTNKTAWLSFD
jgi:hypothetical protein